MRSYHTSRSVDAGARDAGDEEVSGESPFRVDIRPLGGHVSGPTITLVHGNQTLNTVYVTEDRPDSFLEKMAKDIGARAGDVICFDTPISHGSEQLATFGSSTPGVSAVRRTEIGARVMCC